MKTTLTTTEAAHRLLDDNNANWSRAGAFALCEYLEELEENIGEEIEFCPVAIRCDYAEYSDLQEWASEQWGSPEKAREALDCEEDFNSDGLAYLNDPGDNNEFDEAVREFIQDHGTLIEHDGGIIVSSF